MCKMTLDVSRDISEIFAQLMGDIVTEKLPKAKTGREQHPDGPKLSTLSLPYFIEFDKPLKP